MHTPVDNVEERDIFLEPKGTKDLGSFTPFALFSVDW